MDSRPGDIGRGRLFFPNKDCESSCMNIPLPAAQVEWLKAQVAAGRFASIEEAVAGAVAHLQAQESIDDAWAKPLIDEAVKALDDGRGTPWRKGEVLAKIKGRRAPGA